MVELSVINPPPIICHKISETFNFKTREISTVLFRIKFINETKNSLRFYKCDFII